MGAKDAYTAAALVLGFIAACYNWKWYARCLRHRADPAGSKMDICILSTIITAFGICVLGRYIS